MTLPELVVADADELDDLRLQAKWLWSGWIVAGVVALLAGGVVFQTFRLNAMVADTQVQQRALTTKMAEVAVNQEAVYRTQHAEANLLISWGSYVKDRDDIIEFNKDNAPQMLTRGPRTRKVDP